MNIGTQKVGPRFFWLPCHTIPTLVRQNETILGYWDEQAVQATTQTF